MKLHVTIELDNDAFVDDCGNLDCYYELGRIFRKINQDVYDGLCGSKIFDSNGNNVGNFSLEGE